MAYSVGGLIQAADFNGFVSSGANNVNQVWSTGTGDLGWGQSALATVATGGTVTATNWASLVNTLASMGAHTGTAITSRTPPTSGNLIQILSNIQTDIDNIKSKRGNAASTSPAIVSWTGSNSKTTSTGSGGAAWSITFTNTVTFPSADQARYFWNAGGLVRLDMSKTSTGTDSDPDWNTLVSTVGPLWLSGRVNSAVQTINGINFTGFTRTGGSGVPAVFQSTTGWYSIAANTQVTLFQLNNNVSPYTNDFILVSGSVNSTRTALTLTTVWSSGARTGAGQNSVISGGTATNSPFSSFGTAPVVICSVFPPSTTYLTNSWGTPTVAASVS